MKYLKLQLKRSLTLCLLSAISIATGVWTGPLAAQAPSTPVPQQQPAGATQQPVPASSATQAAPSQAPQQNPNPVGTAAAPAVEPEGTPGSRPSGAAIAPGKQKHKRSFAVRTALVIAGVVAVGVVVGLSEASASRSH